MGSFFRKKSNGEVRWNTPQVPCYAPAEVVTRYVLAVVPVAYLYADEGPRQPLAWRVGITRRMAVQLARNAGLLKYGRYPRFAG